MRLFSFKQPDEVGGCMLSSARSIVSKFQLVFHIPALLLLLSAGPITNGHVNTKDENAVKAMFIYNFTKYFDWSGLDNSNEFVIAILGDSPVSPYLDEIALRKSVMGKKIVIRKVTNTTTAAGARMIFIPANRVESLRPFLHDEKLKTAVVISEGEGITRRGAHIGLFSVNGTLRFELNSTGLHNNEIKFARELETLAVNTR